MIVKQIPIDWNPDISIYASEKFLKSVGDEFGWIGGFNLAGKLKCILPYTIIKKPFLRMARFRIETIHCDNEITIEEEKSFLNEVIHLFRSKGVNMVIPASNSAIFKTYPQGAIAVPYGTFKIDLNSRPLDTVYNGLCKGHRRKIKIARRDGIKIKSGLEYLKDAYEMIRDTLKRSSIPFMKYDIFKEVYNNLGENIKVSIAEYKGEKQGCVVVPYSLHSAYCIYAGSIHKPMVGATHYLQWETIKEFYQMGVKYYDFSGARICPQKGTKQEGLNIYKERFGAHMCKGYMWKYSISQIRFALYSMGIRFLRGGDIVDEEKRRNMISQIT